MKRLVIETSDNRKKALENALKTNGLSLTEWFNDRIEEIIAVNLDEYDHSEFDISSLNEIKDTERTFQNLKKMDWSFTDSNTSYLSHGLHPYPAKYIPQIPNQLIRLLSLPGETVWDPFGGSGTTALEALLLGRQAFSSDINPITAAIGSAKCTTFSPEEENKLEDFIMRIKILSSDYSTFKKVFEENTDSIYELVPTIPNQDKWFDNRVWDELCYLKWKIKSESNLKIQNYLLAIFSKIITKASFQDGETRYVSKPKKVRNAYAFDIFLSDLKSAISKTKKQGHLLRYRTAKFFVADLRNGVSIPNNSIDLIVTSPPYPNATDYHLYHRFRIFWLGFDPTQLGKNEIGSHLRHQKEATGIEQYLNEMRMSLKSMYDALRPGRYAVLVLGDAVFKGEDFHTAELVSKEAKKVGFEIAGIFTRDVHSTKRSFISAARRLRVEKFLVLRKEARNLSFKLFNPAYKLWNYEEDLQKMELKALIRANSIRKNNNGLSLRMNSMDVDLLRKLTFTKSFESVEFNKEKTWQAILENGDADDRKRKDPKYVTHGVHAYKGKFYPQLAKCLFNIGQLKYGDRILDPFAGSGTVLLEGLLNGYNVTGFDLNPIALKIARAKYGILDVDPYLVDRLLKMTIVQIEQQEKVKTPSFETIFVKSSHEELSSWFAKKVLDKLATILMVIKDIPQNTVRELCEICLSSIIREVSHQDPMDLRIRRRKKPLKDAPVFELFISKLEEQRSRLNEFSERSSHAISRFGHSSIMSGDCRNYRTFSDANIEPESMDCVVTSPPYATALPYIDTDRLSILVLMSMKHKERKTIEDNLVGARDIDKTNRLNIEEKIAKGEYPLIHSETAKKIISKVYNANLTANVGFRKKNMAALLYRYYEDMSTVLKNLHTVVKSGGKAFIVIGDTRTFVGESGEEVIIKSGKALCELAICHGWNLNEIIPITVTQENRRHNKNGIIENEILWLTK